MFKILLISIGSLLIADSLFAASLCSLHLGVIMPAIIGLPLLVLGLFYGPITAFFGCCFFGKLIKWCMIAAYSLFALLFAFTTVLTLSCEADDGKKADYLIVLGAGIKGEKVSLTLAGRLDRALEYLNENTDTKVIVSGGQGENESISEAEAMKRYLIERGLPEARIILEDASTSTYENFVYSAKLIEEAEGVLENVDIAFVTTRFHLFRSMKTAKFANVDAFGIGARGVWYTALNDYMRECAAITFHFLTGSI